jgi:hypothetical protein
MVPIRCPHCATVFALAIARPGTVTECPQCKRPCRLPAAKPAGSSTVPASPPPPAPAPPAVPSAPILQFDPEQAIPSLEINSDPWSGHSPTQAGKYEERWRLIDPHPTLPRPSAPAPAAVIPSLELDGDLPPPMLEIDPEPPPVSPAAIPLPPPSPPLLEIDPEPPILLLGTEAEERAVEEEMIELPPECVEDAIPPPEALLVVQGVEGPKPPEALPVVQGVLAEEAEETAEEAEVVEDSEEAPEYADAPRHAAIRRRTHRKRDGQGIPSGSLEKVNLGLGFHYSRLVLLLLSTLLSMVPIVLGRVVAIQVQIVTPPLGLIASILCLWIPRQTGARGLVLASLILDLATLFLGLVLFVVAIGFSPETALLLTLPVYGLSFASWVLFMLTLGRLCSFLRDEGMAEEATEILIRGSILMLFAPFVRAFLALLGSAVLGFVAALPVALVFVYQYYLLLRRQLDLVGSIRQVIATRW